MGLFWPILAILLRIYALLGEQGGSVPRLTKIRFVLTLLALLTLLTLLSLLTLFTLRTLFKQLWSKTATKPIK